MCFYECKYRGLHRAVSILFPCVGGAWSLPGSQGPPCNAHHPTVIGGEARKEGFVVTQLPLAPATMDRLWCLPQSLRNGGDTACPLEVDRDLSPILSGLRPPPQSPGVLRTIVSKGDSRLRDGGATCSPPPSLSLDLSWVRVYARAQPPP